MIRSCIVLLSFLCAVLCALVGYLSRQSIQESNKRIGSPMTMTCDDLLQTNLDETARIELKAFVPGKFVAAVESEIEGEWETVCVPLFPRDRELSPNGYQAVVVCFRGVRDRESLDPLIHDVMLDLHYWPKLQELDPQIHSRLARQYKSMDLVNCPVLHYGFAASNPVLGETSLQLSKAVGMSSAALFLVSLIWCFVRRLLPSQRRSGTNGQRAMRGGKQAPPGDLKSGSVLDKVVSARDRARGAAESPRSPTG